jgi:hypothetical protein
MLGIAIGFLIGMITGTIFLVLLRTAHGAKITNISSVVAIVSELFAIPTFWFGGPWVATYLLKLVDLAEIINSYIVTLAIVFGCMIVVPIFKWISQSLTEKKLCDISDL